MPNGPQFGQFGNVSPDAMASVRRAMQRRQQGGSVPALGQQSAVSPTASPLAPPTTVPPTGAGPRRPTPTPATQPVGGIGDPENQIILKAMSDFLKSKGKIAEARAGLGELK